MNYKVSYNEAQESYACTFEYDSLTFCAILKQRYADDIKWMVIKPNKPYSVFTVFVVDPATQEIDTKGYCWSERVLSDMEPFSAETVQKYIEAFVKDYPYMKLDKAETAIAVA